MHLENIEVQNQQSELTHTVFDGLSIELTPAPFWRRFFALCVDFGILGAITYLIMIFLGVLFVVVIGGAATLSRENLKAFGDGVGAIVSILIFLVIVLGFFALNHGFFVYYESKKGATPGKKLFGLKVLNLKGGRLTVSQCVAREIFRYVDIFLFLPGLISWAVTARRQRLGDLFAGTMVTWSDFEEKSANFQYLTQESYHYLMELLQPRELTEEESSRILQVAYPLFVLGKTETLSTLDLKVWAEFADTLFQKKAPPEINDEVKLRFISEISFQKFGSQ